MITDILLRQDVRSTLAAFILTSEEIMTRLGHVNLVWQRPTASHAVYVLYCPACMAFSRIEVGDIATPYGPRMELVIWQEHCDPSEKARLSAFTTAINRHTLPDWVVR